MMKNKLEAAQMQLTAERDEEIEMVINKLESESERQLKAERERHTREATQREKAVSSAQDKEEEWMARYKDEVDPQWLYSECVSECSR